MNKELVNRVLDAAIRAPSGDNVQPWRFKVSENNTRIELYNVPEKDDSYYNFDQIASYIAHGALLENILIAARHLGVSASYQLFPDKSEPDLVAQIDLADAEPHPDPLYQAIFNRRTNRFPFRQVKVSDDSLEKLENSVKDIENVKISLVTQKETKSALAKVLMVNDRLVFERKDIHGFLFDKIRWNRKQSEETRDGMPVETLGLNPVERLFFPFMRFWSFVQKANLIGLSRIIALKCWWNCRNASMLGMVAANAKDKFAFIQGGRAVQRLWLESTVQGFELQPIIGLTLLINRLNRDGLASFNKGHKDMVARAAHVLPIQFSLNESDTMIMAFRLGKGKNIVFGKTHRKELKLEDISKQTERPTGKIY